MFCKLRPNPVRKHEVTSEDVSLLVDLLMNELQDKSLRSRMPCGDRPGLVCFIERLIFEKSMVYIDDTNKCQREINAELIVFETRETVVGFAILAQSNAPTFKQGVEIVLLVVSPTHREKGHGGYLLDFLTDYILRQGLDVVVRCSPDALLMFAMLITRGFVSARRKNGERLLYRRALCGRKNLVENRKKQTNPKPIHA